MNYAADSSHALSNYEVTWRQAKYSAPRRLGVGLRDGRRVRATLIGSVRSTVPYSTVLYVPTLSTANARVGLSICAAGCGRSHAMVGRTSPVSLLSNKSSTTNPSCIAACNNHGGCVAYPITCEGLVQARGSRRSSLTRERFLAGQSSSRWCSDCSQGIHPLEKPHSAAESADT
jgi:hypothetical protein